MAPLEWVKMSNATYPVIIERSLKEFFFNIEVAFRRKFILFIRIKILNLSYKPNSDGCKSYPFI
jgi:hypothetical protein